MLATAPIPLLSVLSATIVGTFSSSITLGSGIVAVMLAVCTMVGLLYGVRYKTTADQQSKVIEMLEAERTNYKDIADRVQEMNGKLMEERAGMKEKISHLEAMPDLTVITTKLTDVFGSMESAQERRNTEIIQAIEAFGAKTASLGRDVQHQLETGNQKTVGEMLTEVHGKESVQDTDFETHNDEGGS